MKKLYSEKEIKESCIKVKRLLPDSDAMDNNFSLQYFNAEISKDFTRKDLKRIAVNKSKFIKVNLMEQLLLDQNLPKLNLLNVILVELTFNIVILSMFSSLTIA